MASHSVDIPRTESWEIRYKILLKEKNWRIETKIDNEWNIETNIKWFIVKNLQEILLEWYKVAEINHSLYEKINSWFENYLESTRIEVQNILEKLYYEI